jgi:site-specific recombinase XerD
MKVSARVHVLGPLASSAAGFAAALTEQGYTDLSLANQLRLAAHFSRWLADRDLEPTLLTPKHVEQYIRRRRRTRTQWISRHGLTPLLTYLGRTDLTRVVKPQASAVVQRYSKHLLDERGLTLAVRTLYETVASEFLDRRVPERLTSADVQDYVRRNVGAPSLAGKLSALRSILRFLELTGAAVGGLVWAVPSVPQPRLASLPKALEPAQVRAVLAGCDRRTATGRRDYAVVVLMVRLGLRACDVASITLDDLDWVHGEIVVRGKGTTSRLPLPTDVGEAIAAYLRRRAPDVTTRAVFLRSRAPTRRALTTGGVISIAGQALRRGGVARGGGHRLRHTAATLMLRRGASLTEIAQVLRHRHIDTTAIYAKVDRDRLRAVAQPWPTTEPARLRPLVQPWPGGAR